MIFEEYSHNLYCLSGTATTSTPPAPEQCKSIHFMTTKLCFSQSHWFNIAVMMVTYNNLAELLYTNGTTLCSLPDIPNNPSYRRWHTQTGLVLCGGSSSAQRSCTTFKEGTWVLSHSLAAQWHAHNSWASPQGVLLIGDWNNGRRTTELLNDNGETTPSFTLDYDTVWVWYLVRIIDIVSEGNYYFMFQLCLLHWRRGRGYYNWRTLFNDKSDQLPDERRIYSSP